MNRYRALLSAFAALFAAASLVGCAQDVGDIDRTQPNKLKKENFEGVWYVRHTVVDAPPTTNVFVGVASSLEKIRWEIQENHLVAYRSYPKVPGYDKKAGERNDGRTQLGEGYEEGRSEEYTEEPIAMYPIENHFDVQRQYNAQTGEPTNVVVENSSDRPWHEREYMRVDWTENLVAFSLPNQLNGSNPAKYYAQANQGGPDAFYDEQRDVDGDSSSELSYFDFTVKVSADPCVGRRRGPGGAGSTGACSNGRRYPGRVSHPGQAEVEIRSSFSRIKNARRDYQPVYYSDEMMTKFGFFRVNRPVYDERKGLTDEGTIRLAKRHDIWKNDYQRTDDGDYREDASGHRIPVPMAEREPKPVVYHLSPDFPSSLFPSTKSGADDQIKSIEEDYNRAFKRTVAAAKYGVDDPSKVDKKMFYVCENPVTEDAPEACDPRPADKQIRSDGSFIPYRARPGDLRRNFIYLVREPAAGGLLGFGPSYSDPETGEVLSGVAHVYGAAVNRKADQAVNVIKLINDDLSEESAFAGEDVENYIRNHLQQGTDPRASTGADLWSELKQTGLEEADRALMPDDGRDRLRNLAKSDWRDLLKVPSTYEEQQYEELEENGYDQLVTSDRLIRGLSDGELTPSRDDADAEEIQEVMDSANPFRATSALDDGENIETWKKYAEQNMYHEDFMFGAVFGLAKEYEGEDVDYQKVYQEIRNEVFRGVMVHELGHTVGLRHNFAGSYDSVNYHDRYWELRKENFGVPTSLAGLWETSAMTDKQRNGEMPRYMYSSIMDYHSRFNGDMAGLGKYDVAALRFAYTTGTYGEVDPSNRDAIPTQAGYVEIFDEDGGSGSGIPDSVNLPQYRGSLDPKDVFFDYDDRYAPWEHPLTDYHYTSVVELLGGPENLNNRELMRYSKLREMQENGDENRPLEVQYMMCSDEYAGFSADCNTFDLGADPFEVSKWAIRKYESYYPFTHFRRDQLGFGINSVINRSFRQFRIFPNIYQRWVLHNLRSRRDSDSDNVLSLYFRLGAFAGANQLKEVLTKPEYGGYVPVEDDDGETSYTQVSRTKECQQGREIDGRNGQTFRVSCVEPGAGRNKSTRYDRGSGYYYYQRPVEVGHFWDNWVAMQALSSSQTQVIGANQTEQAFSFTIPYTLFFRDQLTNLTNGFYRENFDEISPLLSEEGELIERPMITLETQNGDTLDPLTGEQAAPIGTEPGDQGAPSSLSEDGAFSVPPRSLFTERVRLMLLGIQFYDTRYSQQFTNQSRIFKVGSGEQIETDPSKGFELVSFTDPQTGVTYGALHEKSGSGDSLAVDLVQKGREFADQYRNASDQEDRARAGRDLNDVVRDANIVADAVEQVGASLNLR